MRAALRAVVVGSTLILRVYGQTRGPLTLLWDDLRLTDTDRIALIRFIVAATPKEQWPRQRIRARDTGPLKFVENNYNTFDRDSLQALVDALKEANPEEFSRFRVGAELRIPSVPIRVFTTNASPRLGVRSHNSLEPVNKMWFIPDIAEDAAALPPPASADPRDWDTTELRIEASAQLDQLIASGKFALPASVRPFSPSGMVQMKLRGGSECTGGDNWLLESPYFPLVEDRLASLLRDPQAVNALKGRAKDTPLIIIDWVEKPKNHGKKVYSVVQDVLNRLKLLPVLGGAVDLIDLNSLNDTSQPKRLESILKDYIARGFCPSIGCDRGPWEKLIQKAYDWIKKPPGASVDGIVSIHQFVMEAVIWKHFTDRNTWVNMSFTTQSQELATLQPQFLRPSHSFGLLAASDENGEEQPVGIPQGGAGVWTNLLNVTYGSRAGTIWGGYSNSMVNVPVGILAPGCGYEYGDVNKTDTGTSFASPYAATAAWLKHLLDGTNSSQMRELMLSASLPAAIATMKPIESGGVFDLARLLSNAESHIRQHKPGVADPLSEEIVKLVTGVLTISYPAPGAPVDNTVSYVLSRDDISAVFFREDGRVKVRLRTRRKAREPLPYYDNQVLELTDARLEATTQSGSSIKAPDLQSLVLTIREICFRGQIKP